MQKMMAIRSLVASVLLVLGVGTIIYGGFFPNAVAEPADEPSHEDHSDENGREDDHSDSDGGHEEEDSGIVLTDEQREMAGIIVERLRKAPFPSVIRAMGEVTVDEYASSIVSPRVSSMVLERHVRQGEQVELGQALVTLFSDAIAEAQREFLLSLNELNRVKAIGRDGASAKRYDEAAIRHSETRGRLSAYGLSTDQIEKLADKSLTEAANGQFALTSPKAGVVLKDRFLIGEIVEPGAQLFMISDPKNVWVKARLAPKMASQIAGKNANVYLGSTKLDANVLQISGTLDEETRTVEVRLSIDNTTGVLRPGLFVDVDLYGAPDPIISVPTEALLRGPDGDWLIYVEGHEGEFEPQEVSVLYSVGDRTAIEGVPEGTPVAVSGAFFLMAEAAKSGFEVHNH